MKNLLRSLLILTVAFISTRAPGQEQASATEIAVIGTNNIDLGSIYCDKMVERSFRLRNDSSNDMTIVTLVPTCSCIHGTMDKSKIKPGEEVTVNVTLDPSSIRGEFRRSIWIKAHAQRLSDLLLSLSGDAIPLFIGGPDTPLSFFTEVPGVTLTNRFKLTANRPGISLGHSDVTTNENVVLQTIISPAATTNANLNAYDVSVLATSLTNGFFTTILTLPVTGAVPMPSVRFAVQMRVGAKLMATPSSVIIRSMEQPHQQHLRITTEVAKCDPNELKWSPQIEGLEVGVATNSIQSRPMFGNKSAKAMPQTRSSLTVTVKLTPQAVQTILSRNEPELRFDYPAHSPVFIRFIEAKK